MSFLVRLAHWLKKLTFIPSWYLPHLDWPALTMSSSPSAYLRRRRLLREKTLRSLLFLTDAFEEKKNCPWISATISILHTLTRTYTHWLTHGHTSAQTNLVFGRGAAAVLGQVQHGSVALKAGRAVEPVLIKPNPCAHTHRHTHTNFDYYDCVENWLNETKSLCLNPEPFPKLSLTLV